MTREQRDAWVAALRSGEYNQAREQLRDDDGGYCCLGVAAEVVFGCEWNADGEATIDGRLYAGDLIYGFGNGPTLLPEDIQTQLVKMNDDEDLPFPEIADWIEANVPVEEADQ